MFMLIFYLRGINATDLCHLTEIRAGRIEYKRAKTGRLYSIRVEPEVLEIIDRYRGKNHLLNILDRYKNYKDYYHRMNRTLKKLGAADALKADPTRHGSAPREKAGEFPALSTYYARHSWATTAASLDIPKETIAAGLGHGGNTVTDIYIDFDQKRSMPQIGGLLTICLRRNVCMNMNRFYRRCVENINKYRYPTNISRMYIILLDLLLRCFKGPENDPKKRGKIRRV